MPLHLSHHLGGSVRADPSSIEARLGASAAHSAALTISGCREKRFQGRIASSSHAACCRAEPPPPPPPLLGSKPAPASMAQN